LGGLWKGRNKKRKAAWEGERIRKKRYDENGKKSGDSCGGGSEGGKERNRQKRARLKGGAQRSDSQMGEEGLTEH